MNNLFEQFVRPFHFSRPVILSYSRAPGVHCLRPGTREQLLLRPVNTRGTMGPICSVYMRNFMCSPKFVVCFHGFIFSHWWCVFTGVYIIAPRRSSGLSDTAILSSSHRIPFRIAKLSLMGPFSTGVGDHLGSSWCCIFFVIFFNLKLVSLDLVYFFGLNWSSMLIYLDYWWNARYFIEWHWRIHALLSSILLLCFTLKKWISWLLIGFEG